MREALECLQRAAVCETLAGEAHDASSTRVLRDIASQWRQLADSTGRHKRMTGRSAADEDETAPRE